MHSESFDLTTLRPEEEGEAGEKKLESLWEAQELDGDAGEEEGMREEEGRECVIAKNR